MTASERDEAGGGQPHRRGGDGHHQQGGQLYCTVLYCTVLYCTVLCCVVLYCTVLYCTVLYCAGLARLVLQHQPRGGDHLRLRAPPADGSPAAGAVSGVPSGQVIMSCQRTFAKFHSAQRRPFSVLKVPTSSYQFRNYSNTMLYCVELRHLSQKLISLGWID